MTNYDKPNASNTLSDVVVEFPETDTITPEYIFNSLHRYAHMHILPCVIFSAFLIIPSLMSIFFIEEFNVLVMIFVLIILIMLFFGIKTIYSLIDILSKTRERKSRIIDGNYIIQKSKICNIFLECGDPNAYYIMVEHIPDVWINVSESIYQICKKEKNCSMVYLPESEQDVQVLIYIGERSFSESSM